MQQSNRIYVVLALLLGILLQIGCSPAPPNIPQSVFTTFKRQIPQHLWQSQQLELTPFTNTFHHSNQVLVTSNNSENNIIATKHIVIVWASWCPTCIAEFSYLHQLAEQGIPIVGILFKDTPQEATKLLLSLHNPFVRMYTDPQGDIATHFGATSTPSAFIVDDKGMLRASIIGGINQRRWQKQGLGNWFAQL